jgi:hypothetical protein
MLPFGTVGIQKGSFREIVLPEVYFSNLFHFWVIFVDFASLPSELKAPQLQMLFLANN